ncbi:MAG TPA: EamA family transporter [Vicinamibacteria bacterium]|nr:EamA family transporter [Vicinamibacteria bacterium]
MRRAHGLRGPLQAALYPSLRVLHGLLGGLVILRLVLAYAAVYVLWGSTYLPIRVAVRAGTPLSMAALRFTIAGLLLLALGRLRGDAWPARAHLKGVLVLAALLFLGGYGVLFWAEQRIASGAAAVLVATTPLWLVLMESFLGRATLRDPRVVIGIAAGFAGVVTLLSGGVRPEGAGDVVAGGAVVLGSISWCVGTLLMRGLDLPASKVVSSGAQMLAGGVLLAACAALTGERVRAEDLTPGVLLALAWLVLAGSVVAYLAYVWLVAHEPVARVATYAYVNPVVALLLGWWLGEERLTASAALGGALVVAGVAATLTARR